MMRSRCSIPEFTPRSTVARFPGYLRELLAFDGIAAVSEDSRAVAGRLLALARRPADAAGGRDSAWARPARAPAARRGRHRRSRSSSASGASRARKNHAALLDACEILWARGARFKLRLVGLSNPRPAAPRWSGWAAFKPPGGPCATTGPQDDEALEAAYRRMRVHRVPLPCGGIRAARRREPRPRQALRLPHGRRPWGDRRAAGGCVGLGGGGARRDRRRNRAPPGVAWRSSPRSRPRRGPAGSRPGPSTPPSFWAGWGRFERRI